MTAKYINTTPSYKSSSIPILCPDRSTKEDTPIATIANRYSNYNKTEKPAASKYDSYSTSKTEKPASKYEKKDYSKLSVPSITTTKSRDVSPAPTSKYSLSRPSRHLSPERRTTKNFKDKSRDPSPGDRDKDIPSKTDKSAGYNSLSSYKLYPRTSNYTRPVSRTETKPDITVNSYTRPSSRAEAKPDISVNSYTRPSSRAEAKPEISVSNYTRPSSRAETKSDISVNSYSRPSSRAEVKPEISINRYAIANRLSSNYLRSPPTVKRTSVSPVNHTDTPRHDIEKRVSPSAIIEEPKPQIEPINENNENTETVELQTNENCNETETITIITRHTSPTPPGSSAYVRSRRADMAKTIEKQVTRIKRKPQMVDKEIQSDRLDDPTRSSRFGSTARTSMTNWSYYSPSSSSYTGYAGRYSTQYSNLRDGSGSNSLSAGERSGRSHSSEPERTDNASYSNSLSEHNNKDSVNNSSSNNLAEINKETPSLYSQEHTKSDDASDLVINVNLKLKRPKSPIASTELVSPEVTMTNSQLPPQAPKSERNVKTKKVKAKKTSSDSASETGSKKKIIKRRSKSVSSTDSDQGSEASETSTETSNEKSKGVVKTSSSSNLQNGPSKLRHSKSRESNSPESSLTLSTQSSISEEESNTKSKTNEPSRTSADELSIPTDRTGKQPSPSRNENGTEEAKSFLIRALAPVTNLFKMRHQESSENSRWLDTSTSESTGKDVSNLITESDRSNKGKIDTTNIIATNDDNHVKLTAIRPIESGDRAWWLDSESEKKKSTQSNENQKSPSEKNIPRKIRHIESGEKAWWMESNSTNSENKQEINDNSHPNSSAKSETNRINKKCKFADDEKPWWLDSCANIPEGIERLTPPRKSSSDSENGEKLNFFKLNPIESGDKKEWWVTSNENSSHSAKQDHSQNISQNHSQSLSKSDSERNFPLRRIRHIESGERPWWLSSAKNIPEGIEKLPTPPPQEESDSSDSEVQVYVPPIHIPPFPLHLPDDEPLGARRSPEGLETPRETEDYRGRASPYENNHQFRRISHSYQKGMNKYISRYTDIDDILGTSGQIYSPFMDTILARRTGQIPFDDDECEEIDPTQVRIHDSTAQRPVIKKIRSR